MTPYRVLYADSFNKQMRQRLQWWEENREKNPSALVEAFEASLVNLKNSPLIGQRLDGHAPEFRTMRLGNTHHRVAYKVLNDESVLLVAIWDVRKPPSL